MRPPRILRRTPLFKTPYFRVTKVVADFGSMRKTYYVSDHGPRAGVLVLKGSRVLLVSQYRYLPNRVCWEIPGGGIQAGETPATAAARECREEAGVDCRELRPLLEFMPGIDTLDNRTHLFLGLGPRMRRRRPGGETAGKRWLPLGRCLQWIRDGRIEDGLTITAVLAYREFGGGRP